MEGGLFAKYQTLFNEAQKEKEEISEALFISTGIRINEKKIHIKEKEIKIYLSSSERMVFLLKKGVDVLKKRGYKVLLG